MKTLAKVVGLVAGAAAVIWAMRDRFISVATSREPDVPTFRVTTPHEDGATMDAVSGIGPVFASKLSAAGFRDASDLADASPDSVAEAAGVSVARARSWIEQAQSLS